jgi:hypothetical protein
VATPPEKPKGRTNPLLDDMELPIASKPVEPRVVPDFVKKHLDAARQKQASAVEAVLPPPHWPMFEGIWSFPFYLDSLGAWMFVSGGLMLSGWLFMFWIEYGAVGGTSTAYYIGLAACTAALLTLGFAASACLTTIEETSNGANSIDITPKLEWKEWVWDFAHITVLAMQAAMPGYAVQMISGSDTWMPMVAVTYLVFPLVLLGALAADGAWVPMAIGKALLSLVQAWHAWILFYLQVVPMAAGWWYVTRTELRSQTPWLVPLYSAPLLSAIILIYARLIGRLGGCIAESTSKPITEGDDDE